MLKRVFDMFFSACALFALFPVFAVIAILVKLDSPGPVFYRGRRIGKNGRGFDMIKFRTMVPDAERRGFIHVARGDLRITRIGRFLRKYKLDELPQLINVLKGDMSLVGPRPQVKHYVDLYSPEERKSLDVLPGMTDPASIRYIDQEGLVDGEDLDRSYCREIEPDKNRLRIRYVLERSFAGDMVIIANTLRALFQKIIFGRDRDRKKGGLS